MSLWASLAAAISRRRRAVLAVAIYAVCTAVYFACAARDRLTAHTAYNHYALLADCWVHHRLDLGGPPPAYTGNNDFASYQGRWYISFPPFPAVLLVPLAAIAKNPDRILDGQFFLWLAGLGPAMLFLALERLSDRGLSNRSQLMNVALSGLFAFGTVYFFTAEQGTVWFAAHVVAVALGGLYLWASIGAEHPLVAGLALGLLYATRPPMVFGGVFFVLEALRVGRTKPRDASRGERTPSAVAAWLVNLARSLDYKLLARRVALFAILPLAVWGLISWHNKARFGSMWVFGHEYLTVGWRGRIEKWGLASYHYLARNLGIVLTSLPYLNDVPAHVQINTHGLALWITTPAYLWLLWPRRTSFIWWSLLIAAACVAIPDLLYQNSGWLQFGYRFSNDFAVFLFAMLAVGGFRFGYAFWGAGLFAVAVNTFGALTFDRAHFERFYYTDSSQRIIYQPD
jgi:hypothetical protein